MPNGAPKNSNTPTYSGIPQPEPTDAGIISTGGWANNLTSPPWWNTPNEVLEGVDAPVNVVIGGSGVLPIPGGSPQQSQVRLALASTVQLTPTMANAQNSAVLAVSPNSFTFTYRSRNVRVATVDANGLVTAVGRGQASVLVGAARACNLPFSPTAAEVYAELLVTVVD